MSEIVEHTFFDEEYQLLYSKLGTKGALNQSIKSLKDLLETLVNEIEEVGELLEELKGTFSSELIKSIEDISSEVAEEVSVLSSEYPKVEHAMNDMFEELNEFDLEDQKYTQEIKNYKLWEETQNSRRDPETDGVLIDSFWEELEADKKIALENSEGYKEIIDKLIEEIQANVLIINEFNDAIAEIRVKVSAIMYSTSDVSADSVTQLTEEEKEEFIKNLIDNMTKKYYEYIDKYKEALKRYEEDCNLFINQISLFESLTGVSADFVLPSSSTFSTVDLGFSIVGFIDLVLENTASNGRDAFECLEAYINGESFADSGLEELYVNGGGLGVLLSEYESGYLTSEKVEELWKNELEYFYYDSNEDIFEDFLQKYVDEFKEIKIAGTEFLNNYNLAVETGASIITFKELQTQIKYDGIRYIINSGDYELHTTASDLMSYFNGVGLYNERDSLSYLTIDQTNTLLYIFETQGVNEARNFINSLSGSINRGKAYQNAYNTYYNAINDENTSLETVLQNIGLYFNGLGNGIKYFGDGLVDLVAPDNTMSADDYYNLYLLELLSEDESLTALAASGAYNGGFFTGKMAIPFIINKIVPGVGSLTNGLSTMGNNTEAVNQHNNMNDIIYSGNIDDLQSVNYGAQAAIVTLTVAGKVLKSVL